MGASCISRVPSNGGLPLPPTTPGDNARIARIASRPGPLADNAKDRPVLMHWTDPPADNRKDQTFDARKIASCINNEIHSFAVTTSAGVPPLTSTIPYRVSTRRAWPNRATNRGAREINKYLRIINFIGAILPESLGQRRSNPRNKIGPRKPERRRPAIRIIGCGSG